MMLRKLRALGVAAGGARSRCVRHGHSATQMSPTEKQRLLQELQAVARDDAAAAQRLAALMSASTAQNLARALVVVRHEQKQQLKPSGVAEPPVTISMQELKYVALQQGLPFIGFGFVDNAIMIIAGDYIDLKLGVSLGISSMAAAGIGNTISDIAGLGLGGVVEDFCARLGLPTPSLTPEQMMLKETRVAKTVGSSIGVTIGCLLGMLPLLFMETRSSHSEPPQEVVTTT
jgi:hypothetical protein